MRWVIFVIAIGAMAQDTHRLAAILKATRRQEALAPSQYRRIQAELPRWIDVRVKANKPVREMSEELEQAGLFLEDTDDDQDIMDQKLTGFLGGIKIEERSGLKVVTAAIFQHNNCGIAHSVLIYDGSKRIALVEPNGSETVPLNLSDIALSRTQRGDLLVASGWVVSNCTSTWNGTAIRIDLVRGTTKIKLLDRDPGARQLDDIPIHAAIEGDVVTFTYRAGLADAQLMERPGVAKYRVEGDRAVRRAPIATTRGGFIDEWLMMSDSEASRWSESGAGRLHAAVSADFRRDVFRWSSVGECTDGTWEIEVEIGDAKKKYVFAMTGARAADLKMVSVSSVHHQGCRVSKLTDELIPIAEELP